MTNLKFKPSKDRILVEPVYASAYVGTIVVPEGHKEQKPAEAVVVAIGPKWPADLPVKVGDRVLTQRYNGTEVRIGKRGYRLLVPEDVIALVELTEEVR